MTLGQPPYCRVLMSTEFGTGHKCGQTKDHNGDHKCLCDRTWPQTDNKENN